MPKLTTHCDICGKPLVETFAIGVSDTEVLQGYKCGHSFVREKTGALKSVKTSSVDGSGKIARAYQEEGIKFILDPPEPNEPFNCIIGDQMRLGKTPQALLAYSLIMRIVHPRLFLYVLLTFTSGYASTKYGRTPCL